MGKIKLNINYNQFRFAWIITILSVGFMYWGCTDVIEVNLEDEEPLLVVDAWLNNLPANQTLRLSLSQNYFNQDLSSTVEGANVVVSSSNGRQFVFGPQGNGIYIWHSENGDSLGAIGTELELRVEWNGTSYSSVSPLNRVPPIDSITQEFRTDEIFGPDGIYTQFFSRDPVGQGDVYWIKTFKNGEFLNKPLELNIAYDAGFDSGTQIDGLVFIPPIRELTNRWPDDDGPDDFDVAPWDVGDEIRVEIHSIHLEAFSFMETARDQMTNGDNTIFTIPLANAEGNVFNELTGEKVLGIFCVSAVSSLSQVIE